MDYADFRRQWDAARGLVLDLVRRVEEQLETGQPAAEPAELAAAHPLIPFSPRVWRAWAQNTTKLQGVRRLDRFPYATHPTRMALACYWAVQDVKVREDSAVLALVHDYLEEGDGLTREGMAAMSAELPSEPKAVLAAVVLSEPMIDYVSLGRSSELSHWRRVAYVAQAGDALVRLKDPAFANAALVDKIDNLHDLDYIALDARLAPDRRAAKLIQRIGYFRFVEQELGGSGDPVLAALLAAGIRSRIGEFDLGREAVEHEAHELRERLEREGQRIRRMVADYHAKLGIKHPVSSST